jgi:hypothetical protein
MFLSKVRTDLQSPQPGRQQFKIKQLHWTTVALMWLRHPLTASVQGGESLESGDKRATA